jgi:anti-sigma28 factor (negative regulator of flagellin synthesis)
MLTQVSPATRSSDRAPKRRDRFMLGLAMVRSSVEDEVALFPVGGNLPSGAQPPADTPQARNAKIAALRRALAVGRYSVSAEQMAEKIITEHLVDLLVWFPYRRPTVDVE